MAGAAERILGLPATIGRYRILGQLAQGGMAELLLGRLEGPGGFERPVAIKRILPHLASQEGFIEMFLDEARLAAKIRHSNVVHVEDLGKEGGELFIVMEYLEGESAGGLLRRLIARGERLPFGLAAHIVAEVCAGLSAAHELVDRDGKLLPVIHRDVSPENIFITYDGAVKVLDFGVAKARNRISRTDPGRMKGKLAYMAPEQLRSEPIDPRADLFAAGVILFELSLATKLFPDAKNIAKTAKAICYDPIPTPSSILTGYPKRLEAICLRALERDRERRYQTAMEMLRDLSLVQRELETVHAPSALRTLMQSIFADRIKEKRDVLNRLHSGFTEPVLLEAAVDTAIRIPEAVRASRRGGRPLVRSGWAWGSVVLGMVLGLLVMRLVASPRPSQPQPEPEPEPLVVSTPLPEPASAPLEPSPAAAVPEKPTPPKPHRIAIGTAPAGARIFLNGKERGLSPLALLISNEAKSASIEIQKIGYVTWARNLALDSDEQELNVTLVPKPTPAPKAQKPKDRRSEPKTEKAYRRFD